MNLTRRKFLNTVVLSASAVAVTSLVGCGSDSDSSSSDGQCSFSSDVFKHSIMSGDPRQNSVILWTRVNDACELAASRDVSLIVEVATDKEFTSLVLSESVNVLAEYDHNIKLRLTGLDTDTRYYYRFVYSKDGSNYSSNTGRTRTAPPADSTRKVRFAYASCQDFIGRYYNNYLNLLTDEMLNGSGEEGDEGLDFVVHLGDYIYETTGDPDFQEAAGDRIVTFTDTEGALKLGTEEKPYYAAQSLSNYRELYQTYRTDALLQKVQENFPMIVTWDDHEFTDDSWQDTSTYLNGVPGETNQLTRKQNSERAYFESMPIDHEYAFEAAAVDVDSANAQQIAMGISDEQLFPNTKIYRDFTFGSQVHLLMSDFRSNRPDHLIPEDAFPGTVVMTQENVQTILAALGKNFDDYKASLDTYVNIDDAQYSLQKALANSVAQQGYKLAAIDNGKALTDLEINVLATKVKGMQSVRFINLLMAQALDTAIEYKLAETIEDLEIVAPDNAEVGISYFLLGKQSFFGEIGTRYFVIKGTFDLYAAYKLFVAQDSEHPYGVEQLNWLKTQLPSSVASQRWRVLGSSVSFSPLILDLRPLSAGRAEITTADVSEITGITDAVTLATIAGGLELTIEGLSADPTSSLALLANQFYLNVDHWDGFPIIKKGMMSDLATQQDLFGQTGVISIAGDVHSSYIGKHPVSSNGNRSFDLTTSSVSSGTFGQFMSGAMDGILTGLLSSGVTLTEELQAGLNLLKSNWSVLVQTASPESATDTELTKARLNEHSVVTVVADAANIDFTYHSIPDDGDLVTKNYYDDVDTFLGNVTTSTYRIADNDISEVV